MQCIAVKFTLMSNTVALVTSRGALAGTIDFQSLIIPAIKDQGAVRR